MCNFLDEIESKFSAWEDDILKYLDEAYKIAKDKAVIKIKANSYPSNEKNRISLIEKLLSKTSTKVPKGYILSRVQFCTSSNYKVDLLLESFLSAHCYPICNFHLYQKTIKENENKKVANLTYFTPVIVNNNLKFTLLEISDDNFLEKNIATLVILNFQNKENDIIEYYYLVDFS